MARKERRDSLVLSDWKALRDPRVLKAPGAIRGIKELRVRLEHQARLGSLGQLVLTVSRVIWE